MSRLFTRRATAALIAAAVILTPVNVAHAQATNSLAQLSSGSSNGTTPTKPNTPTPTDPGSGTSTPTDPDSGTSVKEELLINVSGGRTSNLTNNRQVVFAGVPYPHSSVAHGYKDPSYHLNERDITPYTTFQATLGFDDNIKRDQAAYGTAEVWENGRLVRTVRFEHDQALPFSHSFAQGTKFSIVLHAFRADHTEMSTHGLALGTPTLS